MAFCDCCGTMSTAAALVIIVGIMFNAHEQRIDCTVQTSDYNIPQITWERNGVTLYSSDPRYRQSHRIVTGSPYVNHIFSLTAVGSSSNLLGTFTCSADSSTRRSITLTAPNAPRNIRATSVTATGMTIVWDSPSTSRSQNSGNVVTSYIVTYYPNSNRQQSSQRTVSPPVTTVAIENLAPHTEYTISVKAVTVAEGAAGMITQRTLEAAPGAPVITSAFNTSSTSIFMEWDPPTNANGIIRAYHISYYKTDEGSNSIGKLVQEVPSGQTTYELTGLDKYTRYSISIQAETVEIGEPSNVVVVRTNEDAPSPPLNVTAYNTSSTSILVVWEPPEYPNGIIRGYQVTYYPTDLGNPVSVVEISGTAVNVTSLQIFTSYSVYVRARTIALGEASDTVNITTDEDAPSSPLNIVAYSTSSTSIFVEWDPPECPNGIIRGYRITYYKTEELANSTSLTEVNSKTGTNVTLSGLEIFTTYSVYVQALTIVLGEASDVVNVTTDEDAPSSPLNIDGYNTSSTSIFVQWDPPATPNGIIRGYQVTHRRTKDVGLTVPDVTPIFGRVTSVNLTALEVFTTYSIYVQAFTIILGDISEAISVTTAEDAPSAPVITRAVNISSTSILVEWNRPSFPNGIIRQYQITYYKLSAGVESSMTKVVSGMDTIVNITGLEIFTTYTIYVQALTIELGEASEIVNITTNKDVAIFQLRLLNIPNCTQWKMTDGESKVRIIATSVKNTLETACSCQTTATSVRSNANAMLQCFPDSPHSVIYRAEIQGFGNTTSSDFVEIIKNWVKSNTTINIQGVQVEVDNMCMPIHITSFDDEECDNNRVPDTPKSPPGSTTRTVVSTVIIIIAMLITGMVIVIVLLVLKHLRKRNNLSNANQLQRDHCENDSTDEQLPSYDECVTQSVSVKSEANCEEDDIKKEPIMEVEDIENNCDGQKIS